MVESFLIAILEGDETAAVILADYLEEKFPYSREAEVYAKRLREICPQSDLVSIVHHFGLSETKKRIRKAKKNHKRSCGVKGITPSEFKWALQPQHEMKILFPSDSGTPR